ncbi:hypothetical protein TWF481_001362 [Arthrobotrys musiformis]|uniref:Uncharacterized protein n=1 Tax=Arthrobotrys musiformis TaxID=47236 RepID=A0AAV9WWE5_9PEZI
MQLIQLLSIITVVGGALAIPAPSAEDHKPTPAKREPGWPAVDIVYESTLPQKWPKPKPRPIYVGPGPVLLPHPKPTHVRPKPPTYVKPKPKTSPKYVKPKPNPHPTSGKPAGKPYVNWPDIKKKIGGRSPVATDPDRPIHILPFPGPDYTPPVKVPENPEEKPKPTTTTTTTTTTTSKPTPTPTKKHKGSKWPAKVRPPYYQPGYGVGDDYKGPVQKA